MIILEFNGNSITYLYITEKLKVISYINKIKSKSHPYHNIQNYLLYL